MWLFLLRCGTRGIFTGMFLLQHNKLLVKTFCLSIFLERATHIHPHFILHHTPCLRFGYIEVEIFNGDPNRSNLCRSTGTAGSDGNDFGSWEMPRTMGAVWMFVLNAKKNRTDARSNSCINFGGKFVDSCRPKDDGPRLRNLRLKMRMFVFLCGNTLV